ncbi:porphobilinogen deaminase [Thiohalorhabdus denitrificans]|uniref:Porphobilinogen deaminase n=1 Tax=Thiohalorhabdus denitrificans TaxID=381306 RepID=A0A0P9EKM1_9GAMM|nr:hydroxymethylbilane synthase [Thiohalorhabdus denitrificans]KPV39112.1 porphobilinogen deaminase [Thiohalorhabdus denitrificans]SCX77406.1 hydroxymethylbilane synthase [Thiohalorhabdus denitrificans]
MSGERIRIGTRGSKLALWQANHVKGLLEAAHPGLEAELVTITTTGDRVQDRSLLEMGGKGAFVKEIEEGLLAGTIDIAVHSMKDVPVELPEGLHLPVVCKREDPRDAFLSLQYSHPSEMPAGARIGSSSLRRKCQLMARFPELEVAEIRGNVDTRLRKLEDGQYDAIVLAAAGLRRLGWADRITTLLDPADSLPAMGQGTIGIECREADDATLERLRAIEDGETAVRTRAEWALNRRMQGGCEVPMGGFAELDGERLRVRGLVGEPDGSRLIEDAVEGPAAEAERLGRDLADRLLGEGADAILERARGRA